MRCRSPPLWSSPATSQPSPRGRIHIGLGLCASRHKHTIRVGIGRPRSYRVCVNVYRKFGDSQRFKDQTLGSIYRDLVLRYPPPKHQHQCSSDGCQSRALILQSFGCVLLRVWVLSPIHRHRLFVGVNAECGSSESARPLVANDSNFLGAWGVGQGFR